MPARRPIAPSRYLMRPAGWLSSTARTAFTFSLRVAFVLVLFEGAASLVLFTLDLPERIRLPADTRRHTRHDPDLGWAHIPDLALPNLYGPGRGLTTNGQGFRAHEIFESRAPADRRRLVCSGSGHTLGRGVADEFSWCAQLQSRNPGLQTVNMGQYGYGVGQSYLWYLRDGTQLDHSLHLFVFARDDFGRMQLDTYEHRNKPRLALVTGSLEAIHVPVPDAPHRNAWLTSNLTLLSRLRSVELVRPLVETIAPRPEPALSTGELADLSLQVFDALGAVHAERGSTLVLVYLPTFEDYEAPRDLWRRRIRSSAEARGHHFVDLVDEIKALPRREAASLYHPTGDRSELSDAGHAWVARTLASQLAPWLPSEAPGSE